MSDLRVLILVWTWLLLAGFVSAGETSTTQSLPLIQAGIDNPGRIIARDDRGNRYVVGAFDGSLDFNPTTAPDIRTSAGLGDAFITRYNADGSYAWTQTFGGADSESATAVVVADDEVYVTGLMQSADARLGGAGPMYATAGASDAFVLALNARDGSPLAGFGNNGVTIFGGALTDQPNALLAAGANLVMGGVFRSADARVNGAGAVYTAEARSAFVLALDRATGAADTAFGTQGLQTFSAAGASAEVTCLANFANTVIAAGSFQGAGLRLGGAGTPETSDGIDSFIFRLNADGTPVTGFDGDGVITLRGSGNQLINSIFFDGAAFFAAASITGSTTINGAGTAEIPTGGVEGVALKLNVTTGAANAAFGGNGMIRLGGGAGDLTRPSGVASDQLTSDLFITGTFFGSFGIDGSTAETSAGALDVFIARVDYVTGMPKNAFGGNGIQTFGGSNAELAGDVVLSEDRLVLSGIVGSSNAGVGGPGVINGQLGFPGFILELDRDVGTALPVFLSPDTVSSVTGAPFIHFLRTITPNPPINFSTSALPPGLTLNPAGYLEGTPTAIGIYPVTVSAGNAFGTTIQTLTMTLSDPVDRVAQTFLPVVAGTVGLSSRGLAVDAGGNRYILGSYDDGQDFNAGVGIDYKMERGAGDVFVTRINADGTYGWTQTLGGAEFDIAIDVSVAGGNVIVGCATLSDTFQIGAEPVAVLPFASSGGVLVALNAVDGTPVNTFGMNARQTIAPSFGHMRADVNGIYVSGQTGAGVQIGGAGARDMGTEDYIAALDAATGQPLLNFDGNGVQQLNSPNTAGSIGIREIELDATAVYLGGICFRGRIGIGVKPPITSPSSNVGVVAKINRADGQAAAGFGVNGCVQVDAGRFGGLAVSGSTVFAAGLGVNIAVDGVPLPPGPLGGIVVALNRNTGGAVPTFGTGGVVYTANGPLSFRAYAATASSDAVFVSSDVNPDVIIAKYNAVTGALVSSFGGDGIVTFGGSGSETTPGQLAFVNNTLNVTGPLLSTNAGVDGPGTISNAGGFDSFLLPLNATTGSPLPSLNVAEVTGFITVPFSHTLDLAPPVQISQIALNSGTLPPGLSYANGVISGTPTLAGPYDVTFTASNNFGTSNLTLRISIAGDRVAQTFLPVVAGAIGVDGVSTTALDVDADGNRYLIGDYTATQDFNAGVGVDFQTARGNIDAFLTRINADGTYGGTVTFGSGAFERGFSVKVIGNTLYACIIRQAGGTFQIGDAPAINYPASVAGVVLALNPADGSLVTSFGASGILTLSREAVAVEGDANGLFLLGSGGAAVQVGGAAPQPTGEGFVVAIDPATGQLRTGFGSNGVQQFRTNNTLGVRNIAVDDSFIYVSGVANARNMVIGPTGTVLTDSNTEIVAKINRTDGLGAAGFGTLSCVSIGNVGGGGTCGAVKVDATRLYVGGAGTNVPLNNGPEVPGAGGYVVAFDKSTGAPINTFGTSAVSYLPFSVSSLTLGGNAVYVSSLRLQDYSISKLSAVDGTLDSTFGGDGTVTFGGSASELKISEIAFVNNTVNVFGELLSTNAGIDGLGAISNAGGFESFLLPLNERTGSPLPEIFGGGVVNGTVGTPLSFFVATAPQVQRSAIAFIDPLPAGLMYDSATGNITGTPTAAVSGFTARFIAGNTFGSVTLQLQFEIVLPVGPPVIDGPNPVSVTMDEDSFPQPFALTLTATGSGLNWSVATPAANGTATASGTSSSQVVGFTPNPNFNGSDSFVVRVSNANGMDEVTVNVIVRPRNDPPVNTAPPTISGATRIGTTVTAVDGTWNDNVDLAPGTLLFTYQWQAADDAAGTNAADLLGETDMTLAITPALAGRFVNVRVTTTDNGEGLPASTSTTVVSAFARVLRGTPVFANLTPSRAVNAGTASIALSGSLVAGNIPASGSVSITIASQNQSVTLDPNGNFSLNFATGTIPPSATPYAITYSYAGTSSFEPASDATTTLTVVDTSFAIPVFSGLASRTIVASTASVALSGNLRAGVQVPPGSVSVTINGRSEIAALNGDGDFSLNFPTVSIPASPTPYAITFAYAGSAGFAGAGDSSTTLTVNARPLTQVTFDSLPVATPNPVEVGQPVVFTGTATSPTGDAVTITYTFPDDGSSASGTAVTHVFTTPGTFIVTVTASDGVNPSATATVAVTVLPADSANEFRIRLKFNLRDPGAGSDRITGSGIYFLPRTLELQGLQAVLNIGGHIQTFTLNSRGRGVDADGNTLLFRLSRNRAKNGGETAFTISIRNASAAAALKQNPPLDGSGLPQAIPVKLTVGPLAARTTVPLTLRSRNGRITGSGKAPVPAF